MISPEFIKSISIDDLSEDQSFLADILGIEGYRKLVEFFGGSQVYVANLKSLYIQSRDKKILNDFRSGSTYYDLSSNYDLSARQIRSIIEKAQK